MDISKELHSFEVEYHIFQEEMIPTPLQNHNHQADAESLEKTNRKLRRQNNHLLEQLQAAHNKVDYHEATITRLKVRPKMNEVDPSHILYPINLSLFSDVVA